MCRATVRYYRSRARRLFIIHECDFVIHRDRVGNDTSSFTRVSRRLELAFERATSEEILILIYPDLASQTR